MLVHKDHIFIHNRHPTTKRSAWFEGSLSRNLCVALATARNRLTFYLTEENGFLRILLSEQTVEQRPGQPNTGRCSIRSMRGYVGIVQHLQGFWHGYILQEESRSPARGAAHAAGLLS